MTGLVIGIGVLITIITLIVVLRITAKSRSKNREIREAAAARNRDSNLNEVILNKRKGKYDQSGSAMPYDFSIENGGNDPLADKKVFYENKRGRVEIQIVEKTELSTRKFVFSPYPSISVGCDSSNNIVSINNGLDVRHFELFADHNKLYVRSLSDRQKTFIRRKRNQAIVDFRGIEVKTGDIVIAGNASYEVTII